MSDRLIGPVVSVTSNHEVINSYSMAQETLKSFDPLYLIQFKLHLFSTRGRMMGDKSITSWAN